MMMKKTIIILFLFTIKAAYGQSVDYAKRIDSLLTVHTEKPFNGVILITQNGKITYSKVYGYSDLDEKTPLKTTDRFVVGSVGKQFTAAIVLREYDKGHLDLHAPVRKYLPYLSESWADTVTVHHLLSHTGGVTDLDKPALFSAGTQCSYSNIGYDLLASIAEKVSGKSFVELSAELFKKCGMNHTFHPESKECKEPIKGYIENDEGKLEYTDESLSRYSTAAAFKGLILYPAAGAFISTAEDLVLWNKNFFEGKLLKKNTFRLMTSKQKNARRDHSIFGHLEYGYGITVDNEDGIIRWGQTGYVPGFASMNFYFPQSKTGVIVLENINYDVFEIKKTFYVHMQILSIMRESLQAK